MFRGRFEKDMNKKAAEFTSSLAVDMNFAEEDIDGSIAHVKMLAKQGIISGKEKDEIVDALLEARVLLAEGKLPIDESLEDIHPNIEKFVTSKTKAGEKMHTGRSRNDQVATDVRLAIRKNLVEVETGVRVLIGVMLDTASEHTFTVMPSYTHTQHAQATTWAHYLVAYSDVLFRDLERLSQARERVNKSPLGSCAIAGSSFPLDRDYTAKLLGFSGLVENSLDATGSRDFVLDALSALSILATDLGRISEDLVLFSTHEYGMVSIPEEYSSTSSAMPQKKNPDTLELVRAKSSLAVGNLVQAIVCVSARPSGYNRDFQEAHSQVFSTFKNVKGSLDILAGVFGGLLVNKERMLELADANYACAIDLVELLVRKGLSFRVAHQTVGKLVKECISKEMKLSDYDAKKLEAELKISISFEEFRKATIPALVILERKTKGSSNPEEVERMIKERRKRLSAIK